MKHLFTFRQRPNESLTGKLARVSSDTLSQVSAKCRLTVGRLSTLFLLLALSFGFSQQAWAWTISNGTLYYDDTKSNWASNSECCVQVFAEKSGGSAGIKMTHISNTKLYVKASWSWGNNDVSCIRFACTNGTSDWDWADNKNSWDRLYNNSNTKGMSSTWGADIKTYHLAVSGGAGSKTSAANLSSFSTLSSYSDLNKKQTVKVMVKATGQSSYVETSTFCGTITATRYTLDNASTANQTTKTLGSDNYASGVLTSTISFTESSTMSGFTFKGWSTSSSTPATTSHTYSYTVSDTKTIYVFYEFDINVLQATTKSDYYLHTWGDDGDKGKDFYKTQLANFYIIDNGNDPIDFTSRNGFGFKHGSNKDWIGGGGKTIAQGNTWYTGVYAGKDGSITKANMTYVSYVYFYYDDDGSSASKSAIYLAKGYKSLSVTKAPSAGSTSNPTISKTYVTQGQSVNVEAKTAAIGYHFVNWTSNNGSFGTATDMSTTFTPTANSAQAVANYAANTYTIQYAGNGATGGSTASSTHTYGVAKKLTANGFTRAYTVTYAYDGADGGDRPESATANYTFVNWTYNSTNYTDGQSVTNLTDENGATLTMTAQWNSGSVTLPTPTKTSHNFTGWYNGDTKVGEAGDSYTPTAAITLTAHWAEDIKYKVEVKNKWGATENTISTEQVSKGVATDITATVPFTGFEFYRWVVTGGVHIESSTSTTARISATDNGSITAEYYQPTLSISPDKTKFYDGETVTITPTAGHLTGDVYVCYEVTQQPDGANPTFTAGTGSATIFDADKTGTYKIRATIHQTDECSSTTFATSEEITITRKLKITVVAGAHITSVTPVSFVEVDDNGSQAISATPATGYSFSAWQVDGAGASVDDDQQAYTTANVTNASATFTASATEDIHTITIVNGTTSSTSAGIASTGTAIAKADPEGQMFNNWTLGEGITLTSGTVNDRTITFTATKATTITANFMTLALTLTPSADITETKQATITPTLTAPAGQYTLCYKLLQNDVEVNPQPTFDINDAGKATFTAPAAGSYTVTVTVHEGEDCTDETIILTKALNITVNPNLETSWKLGYKKGSSGTWNEYPFRKKEEESTLNVAYYTATLEANAHYLFKVIDNSTYYGNNNSEEQYWIKGSVNDWTFYNDNGDCNMKTTVAGSYIFKVDYSSSNPKVSITYPEENYHWVTVDNGVTSTQVKVQEATETPLEAQQYLNGMRFDRWMVTNAAGEKKSSSITINHTTSNSTHMHGATEDGLIVRATYTSEHIIYFKNFIPNWNDVYVYFYSNPYFHGDDAATDKSMGTGSGKNNANIVNGTVYHMTHIDKTDIWYYDYSSFASAALEKHTVAFTSSEQGNHNFFDQCQAVYRGDFGDCANMMVPINYIDHYYNKHDGNQTCYYEQGHWMKYNPAENTEIGIKLHIYEWNAGNNKWEDIDNSPFGFVADNDGSYSSHVSNITLPNGNYIYHIKLEGCAPGATWYGNRGKMEPASCTNWVMPNGEKDMEFQSTSAGPYTFRLSTGNGELKLSAEYPLTNGDFRVIHTEGSKTHWNGFIYKYVTAKTDTASFYYSSSETSPVFKVQRCTDAVHGTWVDVSGATFSNPSKTGIYNFIFSHEEKSATVVKVEPYIGDFYIRTDGVDGGKENYMANADNKMTNYGSMLNAGATYDNFQYNFYKTKWIFAGTDATFCIANDYSKQISDNFTTDDIISGTELPQNTNVRFMWNSETNQLSRAYMSGSTDSQDRFLVLTGDTKIYDTNGDNFPEGGEGRTGLLANETILDDLGNWVYQIDIQANPTARGRLTAAYNNKVQYFIGQESGTWDQQTEQIIGGTYSAGTKYTIRVVYDFKTNLLVSGWLAGTEPAPSVLDANMIIVRHEQDAPTAITFGTEKSMSDVKKVYMAIQLKKNEMTDEAMQGSWAEYSWQHCHYYVSFPFDVKVSEIFGLDKSYYQIQKYNGTKRAQIGWFAETSTFWEKVGAEETLYAHEGYAVQLNRTKLRNSGDDAWRHVKEANGSIYLYFPSAENFGTVSDDVVKTTDVADHECKIDRYFQADQELYPEERTKWRNHKATDSHWNMIGSPLFSKQDVQNVFVEDVVIQQEPSALKFYYKWISSNNSLQITAAGSEKFYSMFGYMVQYTGKLTWQGVAKPDPAPAPARKAGADENFNIELQLTKDGRMHDRTYIQMQDGANDGFVLNEDVYKMTNAGTSNIYSYAGGYDVAANVRPIDNALIELGVKANETGTYTFSMPSNFSGTVTLMDAATQENTILNVADYTITLPQGTYEGRFFLNVEVERKIGTNYDGVDYQGNQVYKFIRNDHMYIMRDGKLYDGVGASVK